MKLYRDKESARRAYELEQEHADKLLDYKRRLSHMNREPYVGIGFWDGIFWLAFIGVAIWLLYSGPGSAIIK